jgi:Kef-type K+ transport system membrane component KefB
VIPVLLLLAVVGLMQAARSFSADVSLAGTELAFGFLLLAAYFTAKIVNRFGFPKLTGYILAGVIAGPHVMGLVTDSMSGSLKVVSSTATAILALEAGSELQFKKIRPVMRTLRAITVFAVLGSMVTIGGVLFLLHPLLPFMKSLDLTQTLTVCMVIGVALSAQSPAVVMAMLAETRAEGPLSQILLASVVVADLVVITLFSVASAVAGAVIGGGLDVQATALAVAWELVGSIVFGLVIGALLGQFLISVKRGASLFALMLCVIVAEIGTKVHLDPLIVMLASGIWLRNFSKADASDLLHGFESAQLPVFLVFFALAGSHLDLDALWGSVMVVAIVALTRASTFFAGGRFATRITGATDVVKKYAWVGLVPQAGLALALAGVLSSTFKDSFGPGASVILLGVVGLNEMVAPIVLRICILRSGEAGKKAGVDFAAGGH